MAVTTLFFDESGYTGTALLNHEQPYFAVASTTIGDEESRELLADSFPRFCGDEFKFSALWRRPSHRNGFRDLVARLPHLTERHLIWVVDKRFCTLTKLIDYLVEPIFYSNGADFYANGFAPKFSNWVHFGLQATRDARSAYQLAVDAYESFARDPTRVSACYLSESLASARARAPRPIKVVFDMATAGLRELLRDELRLARFEDTNEIQITSVFTSVIIWRQRLKDDFVINHDGSTNFFRQAELWDTIMRQDVDGEIRGGLRGATDVEFPLRVLRTNSVRSHDSHAIQLCDVLAGLFAKAARELRSGEPAPYVLQLMKLGMGDASFSGIMPGPEFPDGPPAPRDGLDAVDRMMQVMRPYLDRRFADDN